MSSSRQLAILLALGLSTMTAVLAQSSSSNPTPEPDQAQAQPAGPTQGQISVQARIRARRAQRRAAAIHDAYDHLYDVQVGMGYQRFRPGLKLQHATMYSWDTTVTRYFNERLGVAIDGRGTYGTAFIPPMSTQLSIYRPAITHYDVLAGPSYRFYMQPKYSISGRVMGGLSHGNFSGDTFGDTSLSTNSGLWKDANTYAASAGGVFEYNATPHLAVRIAPEIFITGFGSSTQYSRGFTLGLAYRFGKQ
jgi:hypothetical protein